ncbi:sensor histidine kinase [Salinibacterium sp. M195]|uniref:sensor histidine kinase n=1 Tax=Salinibacterium sp. M195 TaxID=2583374 RepID=UPI001C62500A|nr:histidine kinase [Salinibacterium sp. M195]QYH36260.1 two-component sensor histidine kinase [Salinibacterium sp. M195]
MASEISPRIHSSRSGNFGGLVWRLVVVFSIGFVSFLVVYSQILDLVDAGDAEPPWFVPRMGIDVILGIAAFQLYPFRRRAPVVVVGVIVLISAVSVLASGAALLGVISLATRRRWREMAPISLLFIGASVLAEVTVPPADPLPLWQLLAFTLVVTGVLIVTGMYIGGRRELWAATLEKAASAERELQANLSEARANERASIAREMHDVLAHRLSLVAVQAGALEYRTDLSAEQVSAAAGVVRSNAHLALTELREVLGVLQDGGSATTPGSVRPQPTLANVDELLAECIDAGSSIDFEIDHATKRDLALLPESLSRHLYRLLQESLTNARKHATNQPIGVRIGGTRGERVTLRVKNSLASTVSDALPAVPPSGLGLAGLEERVRLAGGKVVATRNDDSFTVEAWLPWKI